MTPAWQTGLESGDARLIGALALMYLRHDDPARALALGLAAMRCTPVPPRLALLVGTAFLRTGEVEQALAVLERFENGAPGLSPAPCRATLRAVQILRAKSAHRQGRRDEARALLEAALLEPGQGRGGLQ